MNIIVGRTKFYCGTDKMIVTAKGFGERYWAGVSRGDEPDDNVGLLPDACFKTEYIEKYYASGGGFGEDENLDLQMLTVSRSEKTNEDKKTQPTTDISSESESFHSASIIETSNDRECE